MMCLFCAISNFEPIGRLLGGALRKAAEGRRASSHLQM
jgi:hypothetical protein